MRKLGVVFAASSTSFEQQYEMSYSVRISIGTRHRWHDKIPLKFTCLCFKITIRYSFPPLVQKATFMGRRCNLFTRAPMEHFGSKKQKVDNSLRKQAQPCFFWLLKNTMDFTTVNPSENVNLRSRRSILFGRGWMTRKKRSRVLKPL